MRALLISACAGLLLGFVPLGSAAAADPPNACGCYRDDTGACQCAKKGKCACPGECEPVGCEAKRQKQAEKDADAALKRINEREKKKAAEAGKAAKDGKKKPGATDGKDGKP